MKHFISGILLIFVGPIVGQNTATTTPTVATRDSVKFWGVAAANFDFSEKPTANFFAHINFMTKVKDFFYINLGIIKVDYSSLIDPKETYAVEKINLNSLHTPKVGDKYLLQLNKYTTTIKSNVYSVYLQPMFRLTDKGENAQFYIHGHTEFYLNRWTAQNKVETQKQDTATYDSTTVHSVSRAGFKSSNDYKLNRVNGYFGVGVTLDLKASTKIDFFLQPTFGITTNSPQLALADDGQGAFQKVVPNNKVAYFYLIRGYLMYNISSASTGIIGFDVRGMFPNYSPQYALYAGLNLKLEKIFGN